MALCILNNIQIFVHRKQMLIVVNTATVRNNQTVLHVVESANLLLGNCDVSKAMKIHQLTRPDDNQK